MFLSSQFERCEGCVQTVPWSKGDGADWRDHRELPQGKRRDNVVGFCLMTGARAQRPQGEERWGDREPPVAWKRMESWLSPELAFLRVGPGARSPLAPGQSCSGKIESGVPPLAFLSLESPWGWFVCGFFFFFFSYFLKCLNSVSSSWYPLDSGHLRQENKLRQE